MKKTFEQPMISVERFQIAEDMMTIASGWMQFEDEGERSFGTLNGFAIGKDNNTRLG